MALVAVDAMASLHELLRRRPSVCSATAGASGTIASCLDAPIPIYSFTAPTFDTPASKLPRVDSLPSVPDYFAEPRCDSPMPLGALPGLYGSSGDGSFNDLPLGIGGDAQHLQTSPDAAAAAAKALPSYNPYIAPPAAGAGAGMAAGGRHLPRRHASDVVLHSSSSRRGSLDLDGVAGAGALAEVPSRGLLERVLMTLWDDRADRGLFRYDVTQCPTRLLPGRLGFVAQLNEGRANKKRPTEFSADRVLQPFDPAKFNFGKAAVSEVLLAFQPAVTAGGGGSAAADTAPRLLAPAAPLGAAGGRSHLVAINVSPIDYGHVLLLPRVLEQVPQALDAASVLLALQFARELRNSAFRVGYNSLGAFGTINHLHFHTYYLPLTMPCERAATAPLPGRLAAPRTAPGGGGSAPLPLPPLKRKFAEEECGEDAAPVRVSRLLDYPVNGFVVEPAADCSHPDGAGLAAVAAVVGYAAERMQAVNQPFNLLVSDAGRRVFVFPQCYAERQAAGVVPGELLDTGVNPASFEIGGHLVLKRREDFEGADEAWATRLLAAVSLEEERFMAMAEMCFGGGAADAAVGAGP